MSSVRAFLALELPDRVRAQLDRQRGPLVEELPKARWVRAENQHVTLKFLGEVGDHVLDPLVLDLCSELHGSETVKVAVEGSGFFPHSRKPRVAWVGGSARGVEPVIAAVERCSHEHGFARETRPWSFHLTQARLNNGWPRWAVDRFLDWGQGMRVDPFECNEVVLFTSELRPGGAVYTALQRMAFSC